MPYYTHQCNQCGQIEEFYLKIADRDSKYLQSCTAPGCRGGYTRIPEIPGFTSSESLGRIKAPAEFRDLLKAIKKENPGSNIPER